MNPGAYEAIVYSLLAAYLVVVVATILAVTSKWEREILAHRLTVLVTAPVLIVLILMVFTPLPAGDIVAGGTLPVILVILALIMLNTSRRR